MEDAGPSLITSAVRQRIDEEVSRRVGSTRSLSPAAAMAFSAIGTTTGRSNVVQLRCGWRSGDDHALQLTGGPADIAHGVGSWEKSKLSASARDESRDIPGHRVHELLEASRIAEKLTEERVASGA